MVGEDDAARGDLRVDRPQGRRASFAPDQETEVRIGFERVGAGTRVTVEHLGRDEIPQEHAARHGFPLFVLQQRHAEWWQTLLRRLHDHTNSGPA